MNKECLSPNSLETTLSARERDAEQRADDAAELCAGGDADGDREWREFHCPVVDKLLERSIPGAPTELGGAQKAGVTAFRSRHSWKRTLMLSRRWMRPIASAKSGATEITVTLSERST